MRYEIIRPFIFHVLYNEFPHSPIFQVTKSAYVQHFWECRYLPCSPSQNLAMVSTIIFMVASGYLSRDLEKRFPDVCEQELCTCIVLQECHIFA